MRPVRVTVNSAASSPVIPLSIGATPFNIGLGVALSAGANLTYKVQHTFDDVFAADFNAATATWFDHASLVGKTASSDGNYAYPVTAIRLTVAPFTSGAATLTVLAAGI